MKRSYRLIPDFLAAAAAKLAGYSRQPESTDEIDGGVRHYIDSNAPKTIGSNRIVSFFCKFSTRDLLAEDSPLAGSIFTLKAEAAGGSMELHHSADEYEDRIFTATPEFFMQLQQIVRQYEFARYNGRHYTVSGLPPDYGVKLEIRYDSGESIKASNNQSCFLPLNAMEELVALFQSA